MDDGLVLREIHLSTAPGWWPPAPGWWLVAAALLLLAAVVLAWRLRRLRHRRRLLALYDRETALGDPAATVAAISSLLRRAARQRQPGADRLDGDAWLALLDAGRAQPRFGGPLGELLLHGAFRPDPPARDVAELRRAARERFIEWMAPR